MKKKWKKTTEKLKIRIFTQSTNSLTQTSETSHLCCGSGSDFGSLFTTLPPQSDMETFQRISLESIGSCQNTRDSFWNEKSRCHDQRKSRLRCCNSWGVVCFDQHLAYRCRLSRRHKRIAAIGENPQMCPVRRDFHRSPQSMYKITDI